MDAAERARDLAKILDGLDGFSTETTLAVGIRQAEQAARQEEQDKLWSCPECAFTFDASHTKADGSLVCPLCVDIPAARQDERRKVLEEVAQWHTEQAERFKGDEDDAMSIREQVRRCHLVSATNFRATRALAEEVA